GQSLAFIRIPNEKDAIIFNPRRTALPWSIWRHDFSTDETYQLWQAAEGTGSAFRFISAERQLFWTKEERIVFPYEGNGWTQLWSIPSTGGAAQNMMSKGAFEVQFASLAQDGKTILYSSNQFDIDRQHIWKVNYKSKPIKLTNTRGIEWAPVSTQNSIYCLASSGTKYASLYRIDDQLRLIQTLESNFPSSDQLVAPQQVIFSAADGMQIHGQLLMPKKLDKDKKHPALLFFHGGSRRQMLLGFHHRGYYHNAYALNQYLASQGYVVLSVNYRSGIGYGMEFREALSYGAGGASEFNDVLGAGLYLQSLPEVDDRKIGLWGGSYGGYLTALGLAKASDLFAAGVDIHGVHDWNAVIKNFMPQY
ncbi:MAG: prolyl oligopeptidase family serine peptidase, partial [Bacteroidota bacterium]